MLKAVFAVAVLVVVATGVLAWFLRRSPANQASLDHAMVVASGRAIEQARADHGVVLDGSPESVEQVERVLAALHERHLKQPFSLIELANLAGAWGAYIGEAAKRVRAGTWTNRGLVHESGDEVFPATWAHSRISAGPEDNVWTKFQLTYFRERFKVLDLSAPQGSDK